MTLFVDASAMVAMMTDEPGAFDIEARLGRDEDRCCSAIAIWETTRAIAKKRKATVDEAHAEVRSFLEDFAIVLVAIGKEEVDVAVAAHARFGKGHHPAQLNMGDCFAYACAKTNGAKLLYKGDDFIHTDLR